MAHEAVKEMLNRNVTQPLYRTIRREWLKHSIAEDNRDIPGLMSTLSDNCVYEMPQTGHIWRGHAGATQFYTEMLAAVPDVHFDLTHIVIGPQGVWEEATVTGTHKAKWLNYEPSGQHLSLKTMIFFPWDTQAGKFSGERIYLDSDAALRVAM